MDLQSLPPVPDSVVLRDGVPCWASNMAESIEFAQSKDFQLAQSRVGAYSISTVLLPCHVSPFDERHSKVLGQPVAGACFETKIDADLPPGLVGDARCEFPDFRRHATIDEAVRHHLNVLQELETKLGGTARWENIPFRVPAHGRPSEDMQVLLKGIAGEA
ncbi:hypothetical protein IFT48_01490 [Pseudomonas fluorescens]|uniref:hypothetical protein n=1 Tax=Pseudomonas TaxID=286 RepID=UPI0013CEDF60|nr:MULTISPECIES: hypothetical protein [Pseudomonas]MBD8088648.1 hypothetical protein [Pseudomonas fluorescens]